MSRNNLIGVVRYKRLHYVLINLNADTEWNYEACVARIKRTPCPFRKKRFQALLLAHNWQRFDESEYGVREIRKQRA